MTTSLGYKLVFIIVMLTVGCVSGINSRVAFVFAGSPRSFIVPVIHQHIKANLINGLCALPYCQPHVFARLSFSDNSHDGIRYSSEGLRLARQAEKIEPTLDALKSLAELVTYEIVDIGSAEERDGMMKLSSPNLTMHKLFRELDPRRYSMYFNRWSAYQLAVRQEESLGIKFDWVVHARLDFFFGEPVRPVHIWNSERLWVVDQWMYDVPDVFALLPRRYSDLFFSLDDMFVDSRVSCLGGPDFHFKTASTESLRERGYDSSMIRLVQSELCHLKFPVKESLVTDKGTNTQWSIEGISEVWLRRKLAVNGITLRKGTLGYSTFFAVMVRYPVQFVCANTLPTAFIGWIRNRYNAPLAMSVGCFSLEDDFRVMRKKFGDGILERFGPNCDRRSWSPKRREEQGDMPLSGCLLGGKATDWNFMPFQIKTDRDFCMTALPGQLKNSTVPVYLPSARLCNETSLFHGIKSYYAFSQIFSFHPLVSQPQRITLFNLQANKRFCWTVVHNNAPATRKYSETSNIPSVLLVIMTTCLDDLPASQLFRVQLVDSLLAGHNEDGRSKRLQHTVNIDGTVSTVQHSRTTEASLVIFRWIGWNEEFCVARKAGLDMFTDSSTESNRAGKLRLLPCNGTMSSLKRAKQFYFEAERTKNRASTRTL